MQARALRPSAVPTAQACHLPAASAGATDAGAIMSAMNAAGAAAATETTQGPVVAVAVSRVVFLQQAEAGDEIRCHTEVVRLGTASLTLEVEVWATRRDGGEGRKVTGAQITYIAVDGDGRPRPVLVP